MKQFAVTGAHFGIKLANILISKEVLTGMSAPVKDGNPPQYLLTPRKSVYESLCKKYPIYSVLRGIVDSEENHVFRMGGDEFLIVAGNQDRDSANELLYRWQTALDRINEEEPEPECIVACGMKYAKAPYDLREVMIEADKLMYENKRSIKISRGDDPDAR